MGSTTEFQDARYVGSVNQRRFLDTEDGYVEDSTVELGQDDIGSFYVFVTTDYYYRVRL